MSLSTIPSRTSPSTHGTIAIWSEDKVCARAQTLQHLVPSRGASPIRLSGFSGPSFEGPARRIVLTLSRPDMQKHSEHTVRGTGTATSRRGWPTLLPSAAPARTPSPMACGRSAAPDLSARGFCNCKHRRHVRTANLPTGLRPS